MTAQNNFIKKEPRVICATHGDVTHAALLVAIPRSQDAIGKSTSDPEHFMRRIYCWQCIFEKLDGLGVSQAEVVEN